MGITTKQLGELADIIPGVADDKLDNGEYRYFCYQPNGLSDVDESILLPTIFKSEPISEKQIAQKGDVIVKRLNHDHSFIAPATSWPTTISQNLFLIRVSNEVCVPEYLAFLFEQQEILSQITQVSGSAAPIRALSAKMLYGISIPIIPIKTQTAIGSIWNLSKRRKSLLKKLEIENERLMTAIYNKYTEKRG